MVFSRLWNFAKRHRKKLFVGTVVVAGGSYVAWTVLLPRLQEYMLQRLMKELTGADSPEDARARRREQFEHKQQISDTHARRKLAALRGRLNALFAEGECTQKVQEAKTREAKLEALGALQVECLAKAAAAVYMFQLILLVHRVGFNIVGREVGSRSPEHEEEVHAAFLQTLEFLEGVGAVRVAEVVRRAARTCVDRADLTPTKAIDTRSLEKILAAVCREADKELLAEAKGAATFLPDELNSKPPDTVRKPVQRLLDEARDYLDSPQFLQVFQKATAGGAKLMAQKIEQEMSGDGPWPAAKFTGPLTKNAGLALDDSDSTVAFNGAALASKFAEDPRLTEFCEGLFFQGEEAGSSS